MREGAGFFDKAAGILSTLGSAGRVAGRGLNTAAQGLGTAAKVTGNVAKAVPGVAKETVRGMAGLAPGERFLDKPVRSAANFAMAVPGEAALRPHAPLTAAGVRWGARSLSAIPFGVGAAGAYDHIADHFANRAQDASQSYDHSVWNAVHDAAQERTPSMLWQAATSRFPKGTFANLPFGMASPTKHDPVARASWDVGTSQLMPEMRHGITNMRENHPNWMLAGDVGSSLTPFGLARSVGSRLMASDQRPDYAPAIADAAAKYGPEIAASPLAAMTSPQAKNLGEIGMAGHNADQAALEREREWYKKYKERQSAEADLDKGGADKMANEPEGGPSVTQGGANAKPAYESMSFGTHGDGLGVNGPASSVNPMHASAAAFGKPILPNASVAAYQLPNLQHASAAAYNTNPFAKVAAGPLPEPPKIGLPYNPAEFGAAKPSPALPAELEPGRLRENYTDFSSHAGDFKPARYMGNLVARRLVDSVVGAKGRPATGPSMGDSKPQPGTLPTKSSPAYGPGIEDAGTAKPFGEPGATLPGAGKPMSTESNYLPWLLGGLGAAGLGYGGYKLHQHFSEKKRKQDALLGKTGFDKIAGIGSTLGRVFGKIAPGVVRGGAAAEHAAAPLAKAVAPASRAVAAVRPPVSPSGFMHYGAPSPPVGHHLVEAQQAAQAQAKQFSRPAMLPRPPVEPGAAGRLDFGAPNPSSSYLGAKQPAGLPASAALPATGQVQVTPHALMSAGGSPPSFAELMRHPNMPAVRGSELAGSSGAEMRSIMDMRQRAQAAYRNQPTSFSATREGWHPRSTTGGEISPEGVRYSDMPAQSPAASNNLWSRLARPAAGAAAVGAGGYAVNDYLHQAPQPPATGRRGVRPSPQPDQVAEELPKEGNDNRTIIFSDKTAAQDNSQPQRSATGESKGLTFLHNPDHYAQGLDAWKSVSKSYAGGKRKTVEPNPFSGDHAGKEKTAGLGSIFGAIGKGLGAAGKATASAAKPVANIASAPFRAAGRQYVKHPVLGALGLGGAAAGIASQDPAGYLGDAMHSTLGAPRVEGGLSPRYGTTTPEQWNSLMTSPLGGAARLGDDVVGHFRSMNPTTATPAPVPMPVPVAGTPLLAPPPGVTTRHADRAVSGTAESEQHANKLVEDYRQQQQIAVANKETATRQQRMLGWDPQGTGQRQFLPWQTPPYYAGPNAKLPGQPNFRTYFHGISESRGDAGPRGLSGGVSLIGPADENNIYGYRGHQNYQTPHFNSRVQQEPGDRLSPGPGWEETTPEKQGSVSPFAQSFFADCEARGLSEDQIASEVVKTAAERSPLAQQELITALEKWAGIWQTIGAGLNKLKPAMGIATKEVPMAGAMAKYRPLLGETAQTTKGLSPALTHGAARTAPMIGPMAPKMTGAVAEEMVGPLARGVANDARPLASMERPAITRAAGLDLKADAADSVRQVAREKAVAQVRGQQGPNPTNAYERNMAPDFAGDPNKIRAQLELAWHTEPTSMLGSAWQKGVRGTGAVARNALFPGYDAWMAQDEAAQEGAGPMGRLGMAALGGAAGLGMGQKFQRGRPWQQIASGPMAALQGRWFGRGAGMFGDFAARAAGTAPKDPAWQEYATAMTAPTSSAATKAYWQKAHPDWDPFKPIYGDAGLAKTMGNVGTMVGGIHGSGNVLQGLSRLGTTTAAARNYGKLGPARSMMNSLGQNITSVGENASSALAAGQHSVLRGFAGHKPGLKDLAQVAAGAPLVGLGALTPVPTLHMGGASEPVPTGQTETDPRGTTKPIPLPLGMHVPGLSYSPSPSVAGQATNIGTNVLANKFLPAAEPVIDRLRNRQMDEIRADVDKMQSNFSDRTDKWLADRGMLNDQQQIDPMQSITRHLPPWLRNMPNMGDGMFNAMGMHPEMMSPWQKLLFMGSGAFGAGSAMTGHPWGAAMGGGGMLASLLPYLMNFRQNQNQGMWNDAERKPVSLAGEPPT